jgi:hypothetical protein
MKNFLWNLFRRTSKKLGPEGLKDLTVGDLVWYRKTNTLGAVTETRYQQGIPYQLVSASVGGKRVIAQPREEFMIHVPGLEGMK